MSKRILNRFLEGVSGEILASPYTSYRYAISNIGEEIEEEVLERIADDSSQAFEYAEELHKKGREVPVIIIVGISEDIVYAYEYAKVLNDRGMEVPGIIMNEIAYNTSGRRDYAIEYAKYLGNRNIPKVIIRGLKERDSYVKVGYGYILGGEKIPLEILDGLDGKGGWELGNLLEWIEVPKEVVDIISGNADYSYRYAEEILGWVGVPENILETIMGEKRYAYKYASDVLKGVGVPLLAIETISEDEMLSYRYAIDVLGGENVPEKILISMQRDPDIISNFVRYLMDNKKDIPERLFKNIEVIHLVLSKNPEYIKYIGTNENVRRYWVRPMEVAEEYNRIYHGIVWHSTGDSVILPEMQRNNNYDTEKEICVASIFSNRIFRDEEITLIGTGELRMLFDFDIYSRVNSDGILYPTIVDDTPEVMKESSHIMNRIDRIKSFGVENNQEYHDEGFVLPSKVEWFAWTGPKKFADKMKRYGYEYIPISVFRDYIQEEKVAEILYDKYRKNKREDAIEDEDIYESVTSKVSKLFLGE
jgi:hypothetical protein